jgi:hypothetical protein
MIACHRPLSALQRNRNLDRSIPGDVSGSIDQGVNCFHLAIVKNRGATESAFLQLMCQLD